jgi:hypothetical protein
MTLQDGFSGTSAAEGYFVCATNRDKTWAPGVVLSSLNQRTYSL